MSYRIIYGEQRMSQNRRDPGRKMLLTLVFFACFLWAVFRFWPEGREVLQAWLIPWDPVRTMEAAEVFAQELSCGFSMADAAGNFRDTVFGYGISH